MKLNFILQEARYYAEELKAKCEISLEEKRITDLHIRLEALVLNVKDVLFETC